MRILHTADWHLGRQFDGRSLEDDHAHVLEQVYRATIDNAPDLLLVAGNVYDRASPPATAVRQFTDFMQRIVSDTKTAIAIIAGNHDSGDRIGTMALVADRRRAIIRGPLQADEVPLLLEDRHGVVAISGLPFGYEYAAPATARIVLGRHAQSLPHAIPPTMDMLAQRKSMLSRRYCIPLLG